MKVGYLHVGREGGGVRRYGSMIAQAARGLPDVEVLEADGGGREPTKGAMAAAARTLRAADVVHIQWKPNDWGGGRRAFKHLKSFLGTVQRPVVATLHDVWERQGLRERWLNTDVHTLRGLGVRAARLTVHSEEERRRLDGFVKPNRVEIVPHFVEQRTLADAEDSRALLGLT
ncbi:MAG: glycosyltransferase, partial [Candidatus Limnocylindrales bacterium]